MTATRSIPKLPAIFLCIAASVSASDPQPVPVSRVALFSSGVGYFEHSGAVSGDADVELAFRTEDVNDALKSLVVYEGAVGAPSVSYPSKTDLDRALKAFSVDLSGAPSVAELLARARGAAVDIRTAGNVVLSGRVLSVETRRIPEDGQAPGRVFIALLSSDGVVSAALDDIDSFKFADAAMDADFRRALDLAARARDTTKTSLSLALPGSGSREAVFGYVVAAPVWKTSYRLDLSGKSPFLQGWAIVDNATDRDWADVELSLVSGRPVSFIQDLYAPVRVARPVVPLSIAGSAAPRSYSGGVGGAPEEPAAEALYDEAPAAPRAMMERSAPSALSAPAPLRKAAPVRPDRLAESAFAASAARTAGDQFEYTLPAPVTLERGRSALLPLLSGAVRAEKVSVYTAGQGAPALGARLANTTGMKLPAGPITVFDGGTYAGDALIDFLSPGDTRLIAFGEDLDLRVDESASSSLDTIAVSVSKGVLTFSRRRNLSKSYIFKNVSGRGKKVIVEHPQSSGAELFKPESFVEKADGRYRFSLDVPSGAERTLEVVERTPLSETVSLLPLGSDAFLRYSSTKDIPEAVRTALAKAAELRRAAENADRISRELTAKRGQIVSDQARVRANLQAIGRETADGKKYLKRLLDAESEIDALDARLEAAGKSAQAAHEEYERYVGALTL